MFEMIVCHKLNLKIVIKNLNSQLNRTFEASFENRQRERRGFHFICFTCIIHNAADNKFKYEYILEMNIRIFAYMYVHIKR